MYLPIDSIELRGDQILAEMVETASGESEIDLPGPAKQDGHQYLIRVLQTGDGIDDDLRAFVDERDEPLLVIGSKVRKVQYLAGDGVGVRDYVLTDSGAVLAKIVHLPEGTEIARTE